MEIDHLFIGTKKDAPAAQYLIDMGFVEGSRNTHPGQGTANRRFYFQNFMLELLWVEDFEEVQNERTKPMRLLERCTSASFNVSPFGVAFRPTKGSEEDVPFQTWDYRPIYLPESLKIQVADATPLSEPMYFYLPFAIRQDQVSIDKREPMHHKLSVKEVTHVTIHVNQKDDLSEAAYILNTLQGLTIQHDQEHYIELELDNGTFKQMKDLRPNLPLIIKW